MGKTIAEKIFSSKSQTDAYAGDIITAQVDYILTNDASGPLSIDYFQKMGAGHVTNPERIFAFIDHYVPCPNNKVAGLHQMLYDFRDTYNIQLLEAGQGIAHQVFDELKCVAPGRLLVGGDSHITTHGYLGSLAIGVGASDLASAMISGELWFKVPQTIIVDITGRLNRGVSGKDVALYLLKILGSNGANYKAIEFRGNGIADLTMDDRKTICNLATESCAKCAIMPIDERAISYCRDRGLPYDDIVVSDEDCTYCREIRIDLDTVPAMISLPCSADNAVPVHEKIGLAIDMVVIGTCTNGRIDDFAAVDEIIRMSNSNFKTETLIIPASATIYNQMIERGYMQRLVSKGAMILPPGCGPCCGSSPGTPRDGFKVLSTANRNFLGRMGNVKAEIYLASPITAAATALAGCVTEAERG